MSLAPEESESCHSKVEWPIFSLCVQLWEAEQRKQQEEKRQEDLRQQYLKEQEMYKNK